MEPLHYAPRTEWGIMDTKTDADGTRARSAAALTSTSPTGHDITEYFTDEYTDEPPTDNQPSLQDLEALREDLVGSFMGLAILTEFGSMMDRSAGRG